MKSASTSLPILWLCIFATVLQTGSRAAQKVGAASGPNFEIAAVDSTKFFTIEPVEIISSSYLGKQGIEVPTTPGIYKFVAKLVTTQPATAGLHLEFGTASIQEYPFGLQTLVTDQQSGHSADSHFRKWDFTFGYAANSGRVGAGDTIFIVSYAIKQQKLSKYWWTNSSSRQIGPAVTKSFSETNTLGDYIEPNSINIMDALFKAKAFPNGLVIGKNHSFDGLTKKFAWLQAHSLQDVMACYFNKRNDGQNGTARGFSTNLNGTTLKPGGYSSLDPGKFGNRFLLDLIALKMNIAASAIGLTPQGFGRLIFDSPVVTAWDGLSIDSISAIGDSLMEGTYDNSGHHVFASPLVFNSFQLIVQQINEAFAQGRTLSFEPGVGFGLKFTGGVLLADVPFLHTIPAQSPVTGAASIYETGKPLSFALHQNYPNPFNPTTTIQFDLPANSIVTLHVYNVIGQDVRILFDHAALNQGQQFARFDASELASGVYFYKLDAVSSANPSEAFTQTKKMMLIK